MVETIRCVCIKILIETNKDTYRIAEHDVDLAIRKYEAIIEDMI